MRLFGDMNPIEKFHASILGLLLRQLEVANGSERKVLNHRQVGEQIEVLNTIPTSRRTNSMFFMSSVSSTLLTMILPA